MKWLDSYEVAVQSGQASRLYSRQAWVAMTGAQQQAAADAGGRVRGIRYHLDTHPWLYLGAASIDGEGDPWTLWDMRVNPPQPLAVNIPTLRLAQALGRVAAQSKAFRIFLSATVVGAASVAALWSAWRRERAKAAR